MLENLVIAAMIPETAIQQGYTHFLEGAVAYPLEDLSQSVAHHLANYHDEPEFYAAKVNPTTYTVSEDQFGEVILAFAENSYEDALWAIHPALEGFKERYLNLLQEMADHLNQVCPMYPQGPLLDVSDLIQTSLSGASAPVSLDPASEPQP